MSLYEVPSRYPAYSVEVGYSLDYYAYWFAVYEGDREVSSGLGVPTLRQLVAATWGYVDWPQADSIARQLRDDAAWVADAKEDPASRFLAHALSA